MNQIKRKLHHSCLPVYFVWILIMVENISNNIHYLSIHWIILSWRTFIIYQFTEYYCHGAELNQIKHKLHHSCLPVYFAWILIIVESIFLITFIIYQFTEYSCHAAEGIKSSANYQSCFPVYFVWILIIVESIFQITFIIYQFTEYYCHGAEGIKSRANYQSCFPVFFAWNFRLQTKRWFRTQNSCFVVQDSYCCIY